MFLLLLIDFLFFPIALQKTVDYFMLENLSHYYGLPVVADRTTKRLFPKKQCSPEIEFFLAQNHLYLQKTESHFILSKIRILENDEGLLQIDAENVLLSDILHKISENCAIPVLFDQIPATKKTIHLANIDQKHLLEILIFDLNGYELEIAEKYFYVKKKVF